MSVKERYCYQQIIGDKFVIVIITNNQDFQECLSEDYREKMKVMKIDKKIGSCDPSEMGVRYFHLVPGFREYKIFGYIFDAKTDEKCPLSLLGINLDLFKCFSKPTLLTSGPNELLKYSI